MKNIGVQLLILKKRDGSRKGHHDKVTGYQVAIGPIYSDSIDLDYSVKTMGNSKFTSRKAAEVEIITYQRKWEIQQIKPKVKFI